MTSTEYKMLQALPLDIKVAKTYRRIEEWADFYGKNNLMVSFSGGKDSSVLLDLVRNLYPSTEAIYVDSGLDYPEIKEFIHQTENVTILKPKLSFREVIERYGYPVISKEQADHIERLRKHRDDPKIINKLLHGIYYDGTPTKFVISKKWQYLVDEANFKISASCCAIMKKNPLKAYENKTGKVPFVGTLAIEAQRRKQNYLKTGCNGFDLKRPKSTPLAFWNEQDILEYIRINNLPIAKCYGDIIEENGILKTTLCQRTGCIFCLFGCHLEKSPNRIQRLAITHPKYYDYCLKDFDKGGLGLREVMRTCNIAYEAE